MQLTHHDQARDRMTGKIQTLLSAAAVGALALGDSLLAHLSTAQGGHDTLGALLAIGPLGLVALVLAWRSGHRLPALVACLLAAALIALRWRELKAQFVWFYLIQQLGAYGLLGLSIGRTLAHDRVPLCTRVALRVHGTLPPWCCATRASSHSPGHCSLPPSP